MSKRSTILKIAGLDTDRKRFPKEKCPIEDYIMEIGLSRGGSVLCRYCKLKCACEEV